MQVAPLGGDAGSVSECQWVLPVTPSSLRSIVVLGCVAFSISGEALAAAAGTQGQNTVGGGLFLAWAIAYLTRRRAIGGWLLYFYIQLYLSLLLSLFFLPRVIANLNPSAWDSAMLYVLSFLSTVPVLLAEALEAYVATVLLFRRNESNLRFLRIALVALALSSGVSLGIDIAYFSDAPTLFFDALTFGFACIWCAYFWKAKRVRIVFVQRTWDYTSYSPPRVLAPEEKRYLLKRAAVFGSVTFVLFLLMMGSAIGDKKPDLGIFVVPIFYALVAAAIGWYAPIRKRKREALLQARSNGETKGAS